MRRFSLVVVLAGGCVVGDVFDEPVTENPISEGVVTTPRHGDVVDGNTNTATLEVAGVHSLADYRIDVQVLDDPSAPASWTTIGTTLTASAPSENGEHAWTLIVAPAREVARRWPAGGVLRLRVVGASGEVLAVRFHDSEEIAPVTNGMVLVSPSPTPAEADARPRFLDRRNAVDVAETLEYYEAIGAPATLTDFKTQFGFDATNVATTYYNAGDLGIGREMHCRAQDGAVACYVSNYGEFGGNARMALAAAVEGANAGGSLGAFATVAMVYQPPASAPNSVRFMVYGAAGGLVNEAQLDQFGDNVSIPNNCLNCHGGARYEPGQNAVIGARFLPFDEAAFDFAELPGFRANDQAARIRELDALVAMTEPTPAIRELIAGFDSGPADELVVAGWTGSALERKVYKEVVAVACRSCHASLTGTLDFTTAASFKTLRTSIADSLCGPSGTVAGHDMPSAEIPLRRLWTTPARAYLMDYLDIPGSCEP